MREAKMQVVCQGEELGVRRLRELVVVHSSVSAAVSGLWSVKTKREHSARHL
jgi:hypothetical protein